MHELFVNARRNLRRRVSERGVGKVVNRDFAVTVASAWRSGKRGFRLGKGYAADSRRFGNYMATQRRWRDLARATVAR